VTITHPHHPLCGQPVEIVRVRRGTDPDLVVRLPDGQHSAIAMSWTNYVTSAEHELPAISPHLLDFDGLCQVVRLIEHIRQDGRYPLSGTGGETCPSF
jgi:Family of unknown function (DUF5372)